MKAIINSGWLAGLFIVLTMASCAGNKKPVQITAEDVLYKTADININGQWYIKSIVFGDTVAIRPYERAASVDQYFEFTDSTYDIMTNCNAFHGNLTINGDSIKLYNGLMTEIACQDMATEEALRRILPKIVTVGVENDSTIRLNSVISSAYILLLRKTGMETK